MIPGNKINHFNPSFQSFTFEHSHLQIIDIIVSSHQVQKELMLFILLLSFIFYWGADWFWFWYEMSNAFK